MEPKLIKGSIYGVSRPLKVRGRDGVVRTQYSRCCFTCELLGEDCDEFCFREMVEDPENCSQCLSRPCTSYKPNSQTC